MPSNRNHPAYRFDHDDQPPYPGSSRDEPYLDDQYVTNETRIAGGESSRGGGGSGRYRGGFEREHEHFPSMTTCGGSYRDPDANLLSSPPPRLGRG